jgi:IclR family KDG regulon transcriptional repressor
VSIARGFAVIDFLASHGPSSLRGLARQLDLPLGSAHRLVMALAAENVVERTTDDEWDLSYRLLNIAGEQLERLGLPKVARPALERLAEESGLTSFLAIRSGSEVVYLDKVQTSAQVQLYVELGARRPVHSTGLGKAMLAFLPESQLEEVLAGLTLIATTPHTITDLGELRRQLGDVRRAGFATDHEEIVIGVHCLAAPVFDLTGSAVGAISVAGTDPAISSGLGESGRSGTFLANLVMDAAARVSRRLGATKLQE